MTVKIVSQLFPADFFVIGVRFGLWMIRKNSEHINKCMCMVDIEKTGLKCKSSQVHSKILLSHNLQSSSEVKRLLWFVKGVFLGKIWSIWNKCDKSWSTCHKLRINFNATVGLCFFCNKFHFYMIFCEFLYYWRWDWASFVHGQSWKSRHNFVKLHNAECKSKLSITIK